MKTHVSDLILESSSIVSAHSQQIHDDKRLASVGSAYFADA